MGLSYLKLFFDQIRAMEPYSDEEVGRIIRAMARYAEFGEEPAFQGNERFIWPMLKDAIDRSSEKYEELCATRKECGSKGGRPKKPKGFSENQMVIEKPKGFSENQKKQKNLREEQEQDQEQDDDEVEVVVNDFDDSNNINWQRTLEYYGFPCGASDVDKAKGLAYVYSDTWLLEAINRASLQQPEARNWRYVNKILDEWSRLGRIDAEGKRNAMLEKLSN